MLTSLVCGIIIPIQFISSLTYVRHQLHNLIGHLWLKLCKFKKLGNNVLNFNSKLRQTIDRELLQDGNFKTKQSWFVLQSTCEDFTFSVHD
jgi:hypothetical protein